MALGLIRLFLTGAYFAWLGSPPSRLRQESQYGEENT
jgi:hypothetical protein